jgi:tetratricopeptide (TPR) repeat protein
LGRLNKTPVGWEQVFQHTEQALAAARESGDRRAEGNHLYSLGMLYLRLGKSAEAIQQCEAALAIAREIRDATDEGIALRGLGLIYEDQRDYLTALSYMQQALAALRTTRATTFAASVEAHMTELRRKMGGEMPGRV